MDTLEQTGELPLIMRADKGGGFTTRGWARTGVWALVIAFFPGYGYASLNPEKSLTQYVRELWNTERGLPQNSVLAIAQTADGYMWLGTEAGLTRFDGVRFTVFNKQTAPGVPSGEISSLLVDRQQNLWIGTHGGGLSRLQGGRFETYTAKNGLPSDSVLSLADDKQGNLWIGTDGGGLVRFQDGHFKTFTAADGLADNTVFSLSSDGHGAVWAATHKGISRFSAGRFTNYSAKDGIGSDYIRSIYVDRHGIVWIGTAESGLSSLGPDGIQRFTMHEGLSDNEIISIYRDAADTLWVGTVRGGLNRIVNGKISSLTEQQGLPGDALWAIFEDREHSLWLGSSGGGLACLRDGAFTTITRSEGLLADAILPVFQGADGAMWIGSDQGLTKMQSGHFTQYSTLDGLPDDLVTSVAEDGKGRIWAGTRKGVSWYSNDRFHPVPAGEGLKADFVNCIYADRNAELWVGSRAGLSHFDGKKFITYTKEDGLPNSHVVSIHQTLDGAIWIGTDGGGLSVLRAGRFVTYGVKQGLPNNVIWAIAEDPDGSLWLGTNGAGLVRMNSNRFTSYGTQQGLADDAVFEVLDDKLGRLWLSSNKGIFAVQKKELSELDSGSLKRLDCTLFGLADGLKTTEANGGFQPAGWRSRDGRLWFPTEHGLSFVNPAKLQTASAPLLVNLERVLVDRSAADFKEAFSVPPGDGKLVFQFTAPTFISPERVQFRYQLEGFDREWNQADSSRTAHYTNIPPGNYRFRVAASRDGKNWLSEARPVSFKLEAHFYQSPIFFVFLSITLGAAAFALHRLNVRSLKRRERRLQIIVDERTGELRRSRDQLEVRVEERTQDLLRLNKSLEAEVQTRTIAEQKAAAASRAKSDFLANMSHEIRTPINGIMGMTDITLSTELDEDQREYLDIIKTSADALLVIVNDILDFSKIEARKLVLESVPFSLSASLSDLQKLFSFRAQKKGLTLTVNSAPNLPDQYLGDPGRLRQVLLNLLDNAVKFTSVGGVSLRVVAQELNGDRATLQFSVTDTGIGIPPDKRNLIFQAFDQVDTSSTRRFGGTGLGLTISSQLAQLMDGQISVESEVGVGSTFHFTARLPIHETGPTEASRLTALSDVVGNSSRTPASEEKLPLAL